MNRTLLKLLACASMFADHICRVFFSGNLVGEIIRQTFGRLAFPLFAYMLVCGFFYTKSRQKYALCLLLAAIVSEPFFDLAFHGKALSFTEQNTIFTLLLALLMLICIDRFKNRVLIQLLIAAAFAAIALFARFDYGAAGIAVCLIYYYCAKLPPYRSSVYACVPLLIVYGTIGAFLSVLVLYWYKEERHSLSPAIKYAFYLFYPAHLAFLWGIVWILH